MAFFNRLNDLARTFSEKTNDVIETGKLSSKVASERSAAGEELKKIGQHYYNLFAQGQEIAPEVLEFCQNAQIHYKAAGEAQAELDRIQTEKEAARAEMEAQEAAAQAAATQAAAVLCTECGTPNRPGTRFCSNCGNCLEASTKPVFCGQCGAKNDPGTRFCGSCGEKM